ncbi:MAG: hypothetical protein AVDCRST_MAG33-3041, partial [uncultured Thermomicrobiales bacterium]
CDCDRQTVPPPRRSASGSETAPATKRQGVLGRHRWSGSPHRPLWSTCRRMRRGRAMTSRIHRIHRSRVHP